MQINDSGTATAEIIITVFQSAGLVAHARMLARMTEEETNEYKVVALATATILMGAAALEALLSEAAYVLRPDLYHNKPGVYRKCGLNDKFEKFMGYQSPEVKLIWDARIAVAHSEPHNSRSRFVGEKLNAEGTKWVIDAIEKVSSEVWGESMPSWFKEGAGLT
jgi:hypothetical protein